MLRPSAALSAIAVILAVLMAMPASAANRSDTDAATRLPGLGELTDLTDLADLADLTDLTDLTDLLGLGDLGLGDLSELLGVGDLSALIDLGLGQLDGLGLGELTSILDALTAADLLDDLPAIPVSDCLGDLDGLDAQPDDAAAAVIGLEIVQCVLAGLPDIAGSPHAAAIIAIVTDGIASGFGDGTFGPNLGVTRGQMAAFLTRALNLASAPGGGFVDVLGNEHQQAIGAVVNAGIAQGFSDGTFRPNALVTRGQMAAFLARALELDGAPSTGLSDVLGHTHADSIGAVVQAGIAQGFVDGTFRPQHRVTRGQMATFLARALEG